MKAGQIVKILDLKVQHSLYRNNGYWYHHLKRFPSALIDAEGYVVFQTPEAYLESPYLQHAQTLHVKNGINSIPGYIIFSDEQKLKLTNLIISNKGDDEAVIRTKRFIDVFLRNKKTVKTLKKLYSDKCQLCGLQLVIGADQFYSEVHHIVPLGTPHKGADTMKNMICVCPNCHVQLDLGAIKLDRSKFKSTLHRVDNYCIEYHNTVIYQSHLQQ